MKDINPENLVRVYEVLERPVKGNTPYLHTKKKSPICNRGYNVCNPSTKSGFPLLYLCSVEKLMIDSLIIKTKKI